MRHFVTGIAGVVGSEYASAMLDRGDDVFGIDAAEEPRNGWLLERLRAHEHRPRCRITRHRLETYGMSFLDGAIDECDVILHAAASTGIPHSAKDPGDDWVSNVDATRHLLECLRLRKQAGKPVPPTVVLSSVKPYRVDLRTVEKETRTAFYGGKEIAIDEDCPLEPDEPYAASKMAQSALAQAYARSYDLPIVTFRCSNLYGPAPCHGPRHGWLTWLCISAVLGRPIEIQGSGKQTRDMLYTSDVTAAVLAAFERLSLTGNTPSSMAGEIFNLGGGYENTVSVQEAVDALAGRFRGLEVKHGPGRAHEDMLFVTDTSEFRNATGWQWQPTIGVQQGIDTIVSWAWDHKPDLESIYAGV